MRSSASTCEQNKKKTSQAGDTTVDSGVHGVEGIMVLVRRESYALFRERDGLSLYSSFLTSIMKGGCADDDAEKNGRMPQDLDDKTLYKLDERFWSVCE